MSKKSQTILTICVDMIMLAVVVTASYLLFTGKLHGWMQIAAQAGIIIAIPTIFFISFLTFGMAKYEKMRPEDFEEEENPDNPEIPEKTEESEKR